MYPGQAPVDQTETWQILWIPTLLQKQRDMEAFPGPAQSSPTQSEYDTCDPKDD